jgi:hypothetical protein
MPKKQTPKKPELSYEVIGALADAFNKSCLTIQRWIKNNDDRLTSEKAKQVFASKNITWN